MTPEKVKPKRSPFECPECGGNEGTFELGNLPGGAAMACECSFCGMAWFIEREKVKPSCDTCYGRGSCERAYGKLPGVCDDWEASE